MVLENFKKYGNTNYTTVFYDENGDIFDGPVFNGTRVKINIDYSHLMIQVMIVGKETN